MPGSLERLCQTARLGGGGQPGGRHRVVLTDGEFDSERNLTYIRQQLGARSIILAKREKKTWRVHGGRAEMRHAFPRRQYARRALVETLFSIVKCKLSPDHGTKFLYATAPSLVTGLGL